MFASNMLVSPMSATVQYAINYRQRRLRSTAARYCDEFVKVYVCV